VHLLSWRVLLLKVVKYVISTILFSLLSLSHSLFSHSHSLLSLFSLSLRLSSVIFIVYNLIKDADVFLAVGLNLLTLNPEGEPEEKTSRYSFRHETQPPPKIEKTPTFFGNDSTVDSLLAV
jgi:hypothetical protein